jgi:hypothetical protein
VRLSEAAYLDRVEAVWNAQLIAVLLGWAFEHKPASVDWVDQYPRQYDAGPVDDDWYYEIAALRAFEKYGIGLTVEQLGQQWLENSVGTWGSSEQARLALSKGLKAPDTGHPRYNRLWFTMGHQCRGDLFGMLAPAMPNLAARISRYYGHVNSYAQGTDGGVLLSTLISLAFVETDPKLLVRKASAVLHPDTGGTDYAQALSIKIHARDVMPGQGGASTKMRNKYSRSKVRRITGVAVKA